MSIYVAPKASVRKASPVGPGAGILQTEFPLSILTSQKSPQKKMQRAWQLGIDVPWIRAAERVIAAEFVTVGWHLEDEDDQPIDTGEAWDLMSTPQQDVGVGKRLTRSDLWRLTCRHMGLCGNAFWLLDAMDGNGIPRNILYIRPDRMTPEEDAKGNLVCWYIDRTPQDPGIRVELDQLIHFMLEPPDTGHFGIGLVESALLKLQLSTALDQHLGQVLSAGGRLSGIMAPKQGILGPDQMVALERDWRTVVEQSDPAKRIQLVAAPVDFTPTTMTVHDLAIRDQMNGARDDLLGLWGVPLSKLGIHDRGKGLGAATVVLEDDATLWKDGVMPRLGGQDKGGFVEAVQFGLLDRFPSITELIIDAPTFDDDAPKYDAVQKSVSVPLRNSERRDILGLEPFGPDVRNPDTGVLLDDEVWLPINVAQAFLAPTDGTALPKTPAPAPVAPDAAASAAGETPAAVSPTAQEPMSKAVIPPRFKPLHTSLLRLRATIDAKMTPRVRDSVKRFLDEQKSDIADRLRKHAALIARKPGDTSVWFPHAKYDQGLSAALAPTLTGVATQVNDHISPAVGQKASPVGVVDKVLTRGAARVTGINQTTKDRIAQLIADALDEGASRGEDAAATILGVADALEAIPIFDDYRAELIARTEVMDAYNAAALGSYSEAGISEVQAIDGDGDEECAARDGQIFTMDEADAIEDHPNGTLDWVPVVSDYALPEKAGRMVVLRDAEGRIVGIDSPPPEPEREPEPEPMAYRFERDESGKVARIIPIPPRVTYD